MNKAVIHAGQAERLLRLRRSPWRLRVAWAGIAAAALLAAAALAVVLGGVVIALLLLVLAVGSGAGGIALLVRESAARVCGVCGERFGTSAFALDYPWDEQRYVLAAFDSLVFNRLKVLTPRPVESGPGVSVAVRYCPRCLTVAEVAVRETSPGSIGSDLRKPVVVADGIARDLLEAGGVQVPAPGSRAGSRRAAASRPPIRQSSTDPVEIATAAVAAEPVPGPEPQPDPEPAPERSAEPDPHCLETEPLPLVAAAVSAPVSAGTVGEQRHQPVASASGAAPSHPAPRRDDDDDELRRISQLLGFIDDEGVSVER